MQQQPRISTNLANEFRPDRVSYTLSNFSTTCQVRVLRVYLSYLAVLLSPPRLSSLLLLVLLNCKCRTAVFPAGSQPPAPDGTAPAGPRRQFSPPNLNRQLRTAVFPAGPQPQAPDGSVPRRTSTASGPQPPAQHGSFPRRTSTASSVPRRAPTASQKICQIEREKECQKICQIECQQICQKECQKICEKECQKYCQKICQKNVRNNVSRYAGMNVRRCARKNV